MIISVDLHDAKPAYRQITDSVRSAIAEGTLQAGDRLPPIREVAANTRVNRNTVSRAFLELEHLGLVQARQGSGFFVTVQGAANEQASRRAEVARLADQLVEEARLARMSTKDLVQLIKELSSNKQGATA